MSVVTKKIIGHYTQKKFIIANHKEIPIWLFQGVKGIGKCSVAQSFLKWLLNIDTILHPDLLFMDCASSKTNDVREIRYFVATTTTVFERKFVVLDNFSMMNIKNQNILLKLLEKQYKHVLFIIISHDLSNILNTVLSRSFVLYFNALTKDEISLITSISDDTILELANGSAGEAIKISRSKFLCIYKSILRSIVDSGFFLTPQDKKGDNDTYYVSIFHSVVARLIKYHFKLLHNELYQGEFDMLESCIKFAVENDIYKGYTLFEKYWSICDFNLQQKIYYLNNKPLSSLFP